MARLRVCHMECSDRPSNCMFQQPYKGSQCDPRWPQNNGPRDQRRMLLWAQGPGEAPTSTYSVAAGTKSLRSEIGSHTAAGCHLEKLVGRDPLKQLPGLIVRTPLSKCPTSLIYNYIFLQTQKKVKVSGERASGSWTKEGL